MVRRRDAVLLAGGMLVGLVIASSVSAAPPIVVSAPPGASDTRPPTSPNALPVYAPDPSIGSRTMPAESMAVVRLNDNTLVSVKDHGDSQTVLVYTFDDRGVMKPSPQKMKFFYKP